MYDCCVSLTSVESLGCMQWKTDWDRKRGDTLRAGWTREGAQYCKYTIRMAYHVWPGGGVRSPYTSGVSVSGEKSAH